MPARLGFSPRRSGARRWGHNSKFTIQNSKFGRDARREITVRRPAMYHLARDGHAQMTAAELVERLASHRTLGQAPREELEWLAAHGDLRRMAAGEMVGAKGDRIEHLYALLEGRVAIYVDRGTGAHKAMEWRAGDVSGMLPYSRMVASPGDTFAEEPTIVFQVHEKHFRDLVRACDAVTAILVHVMLDRARIFTSSDLHDEKMVSLGKLSAGLAHELNNPASAIERNASLLRARMEEAEKTARILGSARLTDEQLATIDAVRESCSAKAIGVRSPIEHVEREEAIADWLGDHGLEPDSADALSDTAVTLETLDRVAGAVGRPALGAVIRWIAAGCYVNNLASETQEAAQRISGLVAAIKGFTHMDQATIAEPVDLALGLANTIAVLRSKAREKSVSVAVHLEPNLPPVRGLAGELNQIWANLIDNALDAVPVAGQVEVLANREDRHVVVRVVDDGPGIPAEIHARIFDPFFTTKPIGQGTGLGLDIVRRLVRHNDGEIAVESKPGRTEFRVVLAAALDADHGG